MAIERRCDVLVRGPWQADDREQHNESEKSILRQGDNCDDKNRTCVVGPFNIHFSGEKPTEPIIEAMKPFFQITAINIRIVKQTGNHNLDTKPRFNTQGFEIGQQVLIICNLQNFMELNNDWVSQKLLSKVPLKSSNFRA